MRQIADILPIRDADELLTYFHKEECFYRINQQNFSTFFTKKEGGNRCRTCPNFYVKYTGKLTACQTKLESFGQFKAHLAESEKIFGELVAFKNGSKLPDKSTYKKHRMYGHLWPFQSMEKFLMFDTRQNKFVEVERKNVTRIYTRKGFCNFCPCNRKLQSSTTVIKHLQVLETRFFCYLMLEDERYNDAKNQERLNIYLKCIATREINSKIFSRRSNYASSSSKVQSNDSSNLNDVENDDETDYEESIASEECEENPMMVLGEFRAIYKQTCEKMNRFFGKLENKMNSTNLEKAVIETQEQMNLCKRSEDFQEREKDFNFIQSISLSYRDLDYLMNKYSIPDDYEIERSNITLNVQLKEGDDENSIMKRQISIPIRPLNLSDQQQIAITYSSPSSGKAQLSTRNSLSADKTMSPIRIREIVYRADDVIIENSVNDTEQSDQEDEEIDEEIENAIDDEQIDFELSEECVTNDVDDDELAEIDAHYTNLRNLEIQTKENSPENEVSSMTMTKRIKKEKYIEFEEDDLNVKRMKTC